MAQFQHKPTHAHATRYTMKNSQDKNNIVRAAMRKKQQEAEGGRARRRPRNETGAMGPPSARRSPGGASGGGSSPGGGSSTSRSHKPKVSKRVRDLYAFKSARDDASSRGGDFDERGGGGDGRAPSSLKEDDVDEALRLAAKVVEPPPRREPTPRKVQRQHLLPSSADPVYFDGRQVIERPQWSMVVPVDDLKVRGGRGGV